MLVKIRLMSGKVNRTLLVKIPYISGVLIREVKVLRYSQVENCMVFSMQECMQRGTGREILAAASFVQNVESVYKRKHNVSER